MAEQGGMARRLLTVLAAMAVVAGACASENVDDVPATGRPQSTPAPATAVLDPADWNPILATTGANPPPPAASCAVDAEPDIAGPTDQARPEAAWTGSLPAAFDRAHGSIVYVEREQRGFGQPDDQPGQTWVFDVCANTWESRDALLSAPEGGFGEGPLLVYDVDSAVTLAISGAGNVAVYDADADLWTWAPRTPSDEDVPRLTRGAVYDPASGLVLTTDNDGEWDVNERYELWAYRVESNEWTFVGSVPQEAYDFQVGAEEIDLLGHSEAIDQLIFATGRFPSATLLVDPRRGEMTRIDVDTPVVFFRSPVTSFGTGADTVFVSDIVDPEIAVCGFDTAAKTWTVCFEPPEPGPPQRNARFAAMVEDTINERLVLIHRVFEVGSSEGVDDVWAVDAATGAWTELLPHSRFTPLLPDPSGAAATGATSFPDPDDVVAGDDSTARLPLGVITAPAVADRLDFLYERCDDEFCHRDAVFVNPDDPSLVSAAWEPDRPFHVRHGFVNEGDDPLGDEFDVVVYAYRYDGLRNEGAIFRYTSDYVLRGTTDQCGPTYRTQSGQVTCEWFVHEFLEGLPQGRHALWAVWEAPCSAWMDDGFIDGCDDPNEIMGLFASGVDSPWESGPVEWDSR